MNTAEIFEFPGHSPGGISPVTAGKGFALIHRQFMDSKLYKDSQAVHLWIHLILKANHSDEPVETEFGVITVKRGQMITGRPTLVMETFIPDNKVRSLLRTFEAKGMITTESKGRKFSLLTIVKYDDFQSLNCPTVVQQLSINNNNILNTNVFNDRPRKSNPPAEKSKPIKPDAAIQSPKGDKWGTADDLKAAEWIYSKVCIVSPSSKLPSWASWANDIRLMRNALEVGHQEICQTFSWANKDPFWQSNILSPSKLREKWETLKIQMRNPGRNQPATQDQPQRHWNDKREWNENFL